MGSSGDQRGKRLPSQIREVARKGKTYVADADPLILCVVFESVSGVVGDCVS